MSIYLAMLSARFQTSLPDKTMADYKRRVAAGKAL